MAGRPTKCTPEAQTKIVQAIAGGNYREVAAQWAGVAPETLGRWLSRKREPYLSFRRAVLEAEQAAEIRAVALIMKAAAEDPKHAEWWLERKFHERWGRRDRTELTGKDGGPIQTAVTVYVPENGRDRLPGPRSAALVTPVRVLPQRANGNSNGSAG